jgi:hypothetical protein
MGCRCFTQPVEAAYAEDSIVGSEEKYRGIGEPPVLEFFVCDRGFAVSCVVDFPKIFKFGMPILLIVGDGDGGLDTWIDAAASGYPLRASRGRCPGGKNSRTGQVHRVVWAYQGLWEEWRDEEWCLPDATLELDWLDAHVDRVLDLERRSANG